MPEALERGLEQRGLAHGGNSLEVEAVLLDRDGLVVVEDLRDFAAERRATTRTARGTFVLAAPSEKPVADADPAAFTSSQLSIHVNFHQTVNANGVPTANPGNVQVVCS